MTAQRGNAGNLFVSRDPVTRERSGSTTAIHNLLELLGKHGANVTVLVTTAASRSPRPWFVSRLPLPANCALVVPGYLRLGRWYVRPFAARPWVRLFLRALARVPWLRPAAAGIERLAGDRLFGGAWDLTEPTERERGMVLRAVKDLQPATVLANYAFWGALLPELSGVHRAILMHDLLAERVALFRANGLPLDCPEISTAQETAWLNGADTLIAMQREEAAAVRPRVRGEVVLQPVSLAAREGFNTPDDGRCLFVGSAIPPNLQGLAWLLQEVWPRVLTTLPTATLFVVGTVGQRWTGTVPAGVSLLGPVESLAAEHNRAAVCVVPLQTGSGLKIKLLEALSYGKAIVSTTVGVQGVEDWATGVVAVEDTPQGFAAAVVALLTDETLRRKREQAATAMVRAHFSPGSEDERALLGRLLPGEITSLPLPASSPP